MRGLACSASAPFRVPAASFRPSVGLAPSRLRADGDPRRGAGQPEVGGLFPDQGAHLRRPDRRDRPRRALQARSRRRARGNPRHRARDRHGQEPRPVDRRTGAAARRHLQRRSRLRAARAAARARRDRGHHGQRSDALLHRGRRQDPADQRPVPRQRAADEHLPAHRQPGRVGGSTNPRRSATRACSTARAST